MKAPVLRLTLLSLGLAMLGACSDNLVREAERDLSMPSTQPPARQPTTPPPEISAELLPPMPAPPAQASEPRIDIDVDGLPARQFFTSLVRGNNLNMVVHPEVSGEISLNLRRVTVAEAMEIVHRVYGYEYETTASGYLVLPARLQSRTFHVNYLNVQRDGESQTRISSGELAQADSGGTRTAGAGAGQRSGGTERGRDSQTFGTRVRTETRSDFWLELRESLEAIVGNAEGRNVVISPQASLVVVRGMPSELREVEHYLRDVQASMNRQVILEAKILEVRLDERFQSGINWSRLLEHDGDAALIGQRTSGLFRDEAGRFVVTDLINQETGVYNPFGEQGIASTPFGGAFSAAMHIGDFAAFIELLERQGDVQVLSSPRVSTLNNQKAVIKVGSDEFFVTDISTTTVASTATTTTPNVQLTPFFSGIALDVTPQISRENEVILHIHPSVSEVVDQRKEISIGGQDQSLPLAFSTVRESDSIIRARNGQVVVIGGLMQEQIEHDQAGIPVLGRMPMIGSLFRQTRQRLVKTELVILLRPIVVDDDSIWQREVDEHQRRLRALGNND